MVSRTFAALIDQESVTLLEYRDESGGFRVLDTRSRAEHFYSIEDAVGAVAAMLSDLGAKRATVSLVLQHFGSFFHTLVLPPAQPDQIRQIIEREVQRSFNVAEPAVAFTFGKPVERPDVTRAAGPPSRQVFVAGAPRSVVDAIQSRFVKGRVRVETLTVAPEVFRCLYDALDGSQEVTALLVCLQNGPHLAFFVDGKLELAIEPPLRIEGQDPLGAAIIVDQLERGAVFLRQQAHGAVATRLLLSAPSEEYEGLASTIEARTGMHVAPLGQEIGSPESVVAMGSVISARCADHLDLFPQPPTFNERLKAAMSGPGLIVTTLATAAAVAVFWAGMQMLAVKREQRGLEDVQSRVERALPALASARKSAAGRERITSIRTALRDAYAEKAAVTTLMNAVPFSPQTGTQLDSLRIARVPEGVRTILFGRAAAPTGPAAMSAATVFYRRFKSESRLKDVAFESAFSSREQPGAAAQPGLEKLTFTISALSPVGGR